jgi:hypothetical protein
MEEELLVSRIFAKIAQLFWIPESIGRKVLPPLDPLPKAPQV